MGILDAELWLPRDVQWSQIPNQVSELFYVPILAIMIIICRIFYEAFIGIIFARLLGYEKNSWLYSVKNYLFFGFITNRRLKKFVECFFRASAYLFLFLFGCYALTDAIWVHDVKYCWIDYPRHNPTKRIRYILIS